MPEWVSDLCLPVLSQFGCDHGNPSHPDFIADFIELVALKLSDHVETVNVFK